MKMQAARRWLWAVVSTGMMACGEPTPDTAGVSGAPRLQERVSAVTEEACFNEAPAMTDTTVWVGCDTLETAMLQRCLYPGGTVTFTSGCPSSAVIFYFQDAESLFTDGANSVTLQPAGSPGDSVTKTIDAFASPQHSVHGPFLTDPGPGIDSKTGEIDVYTSGPSDDF